MSQRLVRVGELMKREISDILRTRYQQESVSITITDVDVAPNLRRASVFYAVVGDDDARQRAHKLLKNNSKEIRRLMGIRITLKYLPELTFVFDKGMAHGTHINLLIDELEIPGEEREEEDEDEQFR